jgi:hypothetical protein
VKDVVQVQAQTLDGLIARQAGGGQPLALLKFPQRQAGVIVQLTGDLL